MTPNEQKGATGNRQSDFAGTNPDKYGDPKKAEAQDNPIEDQEAQNVSDGDRGLTREDAEHEKNKQHQGNRSGIEEKS